MRTCDNSMRSMAKGLEALHMRPRRQGNITSDLVCKELNSNGNKTKVRTAIKLPAISEIRLCSRYMLV